MEKLRDADDWVADKIGIDLVLLFLFAAGLGSFAAIVFSAGGC